MFTVKEPSPVLRPRILVAAAPKSASTYTASALGRYFGAGEPDLAGLDWAWEHNLDTGLWRQLMGRTYVMQRHMRPHGPNLNVIRLERIDVVVTWRNLADTLVSLDDHLHKEPAGTTFLMYMRENGYVAMENQERYQFLIRYALPWYVSFYCGWRDRGVRIHRHKELADDPVRVFCGDHR